MPVMTGNREETIPKEIYIMNIEWLYNWEQEEIKRQPVWLAVLTKPCLLLRCLRICKIKMELSPQISDIS